jgi:hemolysin-activating ACP:hemolysin acyltransferase
MLIRPEYPSALATLLEIRLAARLNTSAETLGLLLRSSLHGGYKILWSDMHVPIGYIIWANIDRYTLAQCEIQKKIPNYDYEWSDGNICLVTDIVLVQQFKRLAKNELLIFLRKKRLITFFRKGNFSCYVRKLGRHTKFKR